MAQSQILGGTTLFLGYLLILLDQIQWTCSRSLPLNPTQELCFSCAAPALWKTLPLKLWQDPIHLIFTASYEQLAFHASATTVGLESKDFGDERVQLWIGRQFFLDLFSCSGILFIASVFIIIVSYPPSSASQGEPLYKSNK